MQVCLYRGRQGLSWKPDEATEEMITAQQAQIKQGWSLLATLHCVLLPDKVVQRGSKVFKRPQIEMMARRWQHQCLEVIVKGVSTSLLSEPTCLVLSVILSSTIKAPKCDGYKVWHFAGSGKRPTSWDVGRNEVLKLLKDGDIFHVL